METMETGFGVIGVGTWGELHTKVYASTPGTRLAAVCDMNEERARQVAASCGATRVYVDYRDLLDDPDVHAVSIVLPDFVHPEAVVAAPRPVSTSLWRSPSSRPKRTPLP